MGKALVRGRGNLHKTKQELAQVCDATTRMIGRAVKIVIVRLSTSKYIGYLTRKAFHWIGNEGNQHNYERHTTATYKC